MRKSGLFAALLLLALLALAGGLAGRALLVVLLGYTPSFIRINQWQNQAQYEMGPGQVCGFRLIEEREGEIELVLYFGAPRERARRRPGAACGCA